MGQSGESLFPQSGEVSLAQQGQGPAVREADLHSVGRHGEAAHGRHCGVPAPDDPTVAPGQIGGGDLVVPTIGHEGAAGFHGRELRTVQGLPQNAAQFRLRLSAPGGEADDVGISRQKADDISIGEHGGNVGGSHMEEEPPAQPGGKAGMAVLQGFQTGSAAPESEGRQFLTPLAGSPDGDRKSVQEVQRLGREGDPGLRRRMLHPCQQDDVIPHKCRCTPSPPPGAPAP